jgi:hypothetical protein
MTATTQGEAGIVDLLRSDLHRAREDYGQAMAEVGRLRGETDAAKALAARVEPLAAAEAEARARADQLATENANLRHWLAWRTIALEILLLGVAGISAVIWITRWWPWE